jgi:hypothetical protein
MHRAMRARGCDFILIPIIPRVRAAQIENCADVMRLNLFAKLLSVQLGRAVKLPLGNHMMVAAPDQ